jgi:hypothetical protein
MPGEKWIKTLADGRKVKFICQELPVDGAFLTAQLAGNEIVYSVVLTKAKSRLVVKMLKATLRASFQRSNALILEHSPQNHIFRNCAMLWCASAAYES